MLTLVGTFTYTAGDDVNNRPVYRQQGGTAYFAVKTTTSPGKAIWVGSNTVLGTEPGDEGGLIMEADLLNPKARTNNIRREYILVTSSVRMESLTGTLV